MILARWPGTQSSILALGAFRVRPGGQRPRGRRNTGRASPPGSSPSGSSPVSGSGLRLGAGRRVGVARRAGGGSSTGLGVVRGSGGLRTATVLREDAVGRLGRDADGVDRGLKRLADAGVHPSRLQREHGAQDLACGVGADRKAQFAQTLAQQLDRAEPGSWAAAAGGGVGWVIACAPSGQSRSPSSARQRSSSPRER